MFGSLTQLIGLENLQAQSPLPQMSQQPLTQGTAVYMGSPAKRFVTAPKENKMNYVKEYFVKHRELFMGLFVVILLDHYIFKDAFREKLQQIVHGFLDKTQKKLAEGDKQ